MHQQFVYQPFLLVTGQVLGEQVREVLPRVGIESPGQLHLHVLHLLLRVLVLALSVFAVGRTLAIFIALNSILQVSARGFPGLKIDLRLADLLHGDLGVAARASMITARNYLGLQYGLDVVGTLVVEIRIFEDGNVLVNGVVESGLERIERIELSLLFELSPIGDQVVEVLSLVLLIDLDLLEQKVTVVREKEFVVELGKEDENLIDKSIHITDELRVVHVEGVLNLLENPLKKQMNILFGLGLLGQGLFGRRSFFEFNGPSLRPETQSNPQGLLLSFVTLGTLGVGEMRGEL